VRHVVFDYGGDRVPLPIRPAAGVDALYAPRRTVLDALIVDAARAAGAVVRFGGTVTGVLRDDAGRVSGLTVRDRTGRVDDVRAGLVVGADGRRSGLADAVGAPVEVRGRAASAFLYGYWTGLDVRGYEWFFHPGASAGAIPTNDGLTCVFVGARPDRVAALVGAGGGARAFARLAADGGVEARLRAGKRVGALRHVRAQTGALRRSWGPGWALVGDAGHWKDPLSTHGITDALRDAELLARAVVSAPEPGAAQLDALAGYQRARDVMAIPMLTVSDRLASYDWTSAEVRGLLRTLAAAMADEVELLAELPAGAAA
jgi:2-polyprenyl-6-methoxyphenol hydroxylase-like FAD-dependent oxidoreductase